jgi:CysZ protein
MFASLGRALGLVFDPALYGVILRSLILTVVLFILLAVGVEYAVHALPTLGSPWVNRVLALMAPILLLLGFVLLGAPVAAVFASLYLDKVADAIEARAYAADPKARGLSFGTGAWAGVRLAGAVLLVDLVLLPAEALLPGLAEVLMIIVNGFLLGREYFELAALRHISVKAADALRRRNGAAVFGGGLVISFLSAVPVANFFAPLFGAALMVHLYKRLEGDKEHP